MESILLSFKALRNFYTSYETPSGFGENQFSIKVGTFSGVGKALQSQRCSLENLTIDCCQFYDILNLKVNLEPIGSLRGFLKLCVINIPTSVLLGHGILKALSLATFFQPLSSLST